MANSKLIGKWQAETISMGGLSIDVNTMLEGEMFITFKRGGECVSEVVAENVSETKKGTWSYADGILTTNIDGETSDVTVVELTNSRLVVSQKGEILEQETESTITFKKVS
jgi:hypothetical protein